MERNKSGWRKWERERGREGVNESESWKQALLKISCHECLFLFDVCSILAHSTCTLFGSGCFCYSFFTFILISLRIFHFILYSLFCWGFFFLQEKEKRRKKWKERGKDEIFLKMFWQSEKCSYISLFDCTHKWTASINFVNCRVLLMHTRIE